MRTDDYLLDQADRTQRSHTRRRRENRSRRKHLYVIGGVAFLAVFGLMAPALISHSPIGRGFVIRSLESYGLTGEVESMRIGWVTPLRIDGLQIQGDAGSGLTVRQLDVDLTVTDLISSPSGVIGQIKARGVDLHCSMGNGRCSLEDDLAVLLEPSESNATPTAAINIEDVTIAVADADSGAVWQVTQAGAEVAVSADRVQASFAGVLTEQGGSAGSLQGSAEYQQFDQSGNQPAKWRLDLVSESLPLSVVTLLRRRFPESAASIPAQVHGDATGSVVLTGQTDGAIEASVQQLNIRNFTAADQGSRVWSNRLATLNGDLVLIGDRVIGRHLTATSDFAAAKIDGAFTRTFSLVGVNDNPLRWLEAIDGTATIEADLAAFDQSLPGMLPLREEAELISGQLVARVDSTVNGNARRSELKINSNAIRARNQGRAVVIDPIEVMAVVSSNGGPLRADQFEWKSAFGNAVGQGDLRSGSADIEVDFGRLTAMLRPIMHVSESSLDGSIRGKIGWNAASNNSWRLSGEGSATNLVISMSNGQTLRRPSMQGKVEAVGRWGNDSLEELTRADVSLATSGLDVSAELEQAVRNPSSTIPIPIRIAGNGRVDTLLEVLGPWMPPELHDAAGTFRGSARADVSTLSARLTDASIDLTDPKIAYADRYFSQPRIKVNFAGEYTLPANDIRARTLTVAGDAFSMAAIGNASAEQVDMEIRWRAKLERIQGSVRPQIATRLGGAIQRVGYRRDRQIRQLDIGNEQWLLMGDCEGAIQLQTESGLLNIDTHAKGTNLAIVQPRAVAANFQTVGPVPISQQIDPRRTKSLQGQVVWSEPEVKVDGWIRYDEQTGQVSADKLQVAGQWFASTLAGSMQWNEQAGFVELRGPARLNMDQVSERISRLLGVDVTAEGIHETPLDIQISRRDEGDAAIRIAANVGWERSELGGVVMGQASIPLVLTETSVDIAPAKIAVGNDPSELGQISLAGQIHYRPGPLWMRLEPGSHADSIRLTREMTDKWLKYLAPLAANAARIDGTVGVEIDEALIVVDQPEQSRVAGRLNIAGVEMTSGPMADQIYGGINQLRLLAKAGSVADQPAGNHTLITMPPQTVDFVVDRGDVFHNRMFFEVDRAEVITSGKVAMNGRLNIDAQIPLDERWLGNDLKGMANQPVNLPIDGTLSRPSLDSSGVRQVVVQLTRQAVQETAGNYLQDQLQKQFGKGIEKLFGR